MSMNSFVALLDTVNQAGEVGYSWTAQAMAHLAAAHPEDHGPECPVCLFLDEWMNGDPDYCRPGEPHDYVGRGE